MRVLTFPPPFPRRPTFVSLLRTNLISTRLPKACATRINFPIVKFLGSFSIAEIFGALISAIAASFVWLRFSAARNFAICTPSCRFCNTAIWSGRESIRQHAQALRRTSPVRGSGLLHGAAVGIERRRTLQMRRGIPQPRKTVVVQVREDGRDSPATAFFTRRLGAPRTCVEMRKDQLIHRIIARVGFEQRVANLGQRSVGWSCHRVGWARHGSSASLPEFPI